MQAKAQKENWPSESVLIGEIEECPPPLWVLGYEWGTPEKVVIKGFARGGGFLQSGEGRQERLGEEWLLN